MITNNPDFLTESPKNKLNLKILSNAVVLDSISHAYLFSGTNADLLKDLALSFAAAVNCENNGCGTCRICLNSLKGIYENMLFVEAEGTEITIDKIRQIQHFMSRSAHAPGRKICIIKEAELMNEVASNSLLKILEEPPDKNSIFILLAESVPALLPTISSRCIIFDWDFKDNGSSSDIRINEDRKELFALTDKGIKELLLTGGSYAGAADLSLKITDFFKQQFSFKEDEHREQIGKMKDFFATDAELKKYEASLKAAQKRRKNKYYNLGMQFVFDIITAWLIDIISVIAGAGPDGLNYPANFDFIEKNAVLIKPDELLSITDVIEKNRTYLKYSIYDEIALDNIFLKLRKAMEQN